MLSDDQIKFIAIYPALSGIIRRPVLVCDPKKADKMVKLLKVLASMGKLFTKLVVNRTTQL